MKEIDKHMFLKMLSKIYQDHIGVILEPSSEFLGVEVWEYSF